jgi:hypothetical protein
MTRTWTSSWRPRRRMPSRSRAARWGPLLELLAVPSLPAVSTWRSARLHAEPLPSQAAAQGAFMRLSRTTSLR